MLGKQSISSQGPYILHTNNSKYVGELNIKGKTKNIYPKKDFFGKTHTHTSLQREQTNNVSYYSDQKKTQRQRKSK